MPKWISKIREGLIQEKTGVQFFKFSIVGFMNTALDFSVLNLLILIFGLRGSVIRYVIFTAAAVLISFTNSFIWNKNWTFRSNTPVGRIKKEFLLFFLIAGTGMLWNITTATAVYATIEYVFPSIPDLISANAGALSALIVVILWDFLGYKYIVFKK